MQPYNVRMQQQSWVDAALAMPWIAWSVGGLLIALGLFLLWLFLFSDRSRGRRRCPKCWYDLRGTPGLRCSECGYEARRERAFFRTRRRWRASFWATVLVLFGSSVALAPQVRRGGWLAPIPTSVLLWLAPPCSRTTQPGQLQHWTEQELERRDAAATLSDWQRRYMLLQKQGLRYRAKWPVWYPLYVETWQPNWGPMWNIVFGELPTDRFSSGVAAPHYRTQLGPARVDFPTVLTLSIDSTSNGVLKSGKPRQTNYSWTGQIQLPIRVVPSIDDAMTRLSGPKIDELVRRALQVQIAPNLYGNPPIEIYDASQGALALAYPFSSVRCVLDRNVDPALRDLAFGFRVTIRRGDRIVESFDMAPDLAYGSLYTGTTDRMLSAFVELSSDIGSVDLRSSDSWAIEIRGYPSGALLDWDRNSFWDGTITLTTAELWMYGRDASDKLLGPKDYWDTPRPMSLREALQALGRR
jgi:hypothetical protein